jgi:hypothetical protein
VVAGGGFALLSWVAVAFVTRSLLTIASLFSQEQELYIANTQLQSQLAENQHIQRSQGLL